MSFDALVIGAGINGLVAAAHLGAQGRRVGVFEGGTVPGGAVKTAEVTTPGFKHDLGAMNLSLFAGSAFHSEHGAALASHGFELAPATDTFATAFPDGRWLGVTNDLDTTAARIAAFDEHDAAAWRKMSAGFMGELEDIGGLLNTPMTRGRLAKYLWKLWRKRGTGGTVELARFMTSSPRAFLDENFRSPELKAMMAAWGMHLDFAPDVAGGAVFPYLESFANQSFGMVLGKGGAGGLITALVKMIEAQNGEVRTNARVTNILRTGRTANGIRLADGTTVTARKAVIANTGPAALVHLLDEETGDDHYDDRALAFRYAPGTMMIHLAMDALPDWTAGDDLKRFAYVHLAPSLGMMDIAYAQAKAGLLPAEPVVVCGQPTAVDPSRAPDGKHILWLQVRMVPAHIEGDALGKIDGIEWDDVKDAYADRVLDILERYAPGTRDKIIARHVVSPLDLEADNPNLVGGDQISGSHHLSQNFLFRGPPGHADWSTPVGNLFHVGASTWPGAGTGAGSGYMLAQRLIRGRH
ncbi:MAG: FAD-dependent oxidoreductase [Rhodobacteraceae bacterium]|nr:FAD-dependent oxidoreductase [Paracoccaceae bacterium]